MGVIEVLQLFTYLLTYMIYKTLFHKAGIVRLD